MVALFLFMEYICNMKNIIIIDVDTDRKQVVQIGKPTAGELPKNEAEAKDTIIKDMACMTEALITLIQAADQNGYKTVEQSMQDVTMHLERAFSGPIEATSVSDEPKNEVVECLKTDTEKANCTTPCKACSSEVKEDFNCTKVGVGEDRCEVQCQTCFVFGK